MKKLETALTKVYEAILEKEPIANQIAATVHPDYEFSAKNLYRYLMLRSFDLREVHDGLSAFGISSMRTAESYVWDNVTNSLKIINLLQGKEWMPESNIQTLGYQKSRKLLTKHANQLFNVTNKKHTTEIMVTMPTAASEDLELVRDLIGTGMEIARIDLSHDNLEIWQKMVENLKLMSRQLNLPIKIYMDLSGPKIRTGAIAIPRRTKKKKEKIDDFIKLKVGEHLILTKRATNGKRAIYRNEKELVSFAEVGISLPQIIEDLVVGDPIFFDDGMIEGKVLAKTAEDIELVITKTHKTKLKARKGINLPDTHLNLPSLTDRDIELLPFIVQHADIVGYSFVRNAKDVQKLYSELDKLGNKDIGVVFKIENKEAFENLSLILFEAMKRQKIGVMIARGDLAVELGYERISEVQQQILWFCEAAHVPVIWATQVLENLAKTGIATRAEVSDVSLSAQAECVMLNKGPHIVEAIQLLKRILVRMEAHGSKKKSTMRALNVAKLKLDALHSIFKN